MGLAHVELSMSILCPQLRPRAWRRSQLWLPSVRWPGQQPAAHHKNAVKPARNGARLPTRQHCSSQAICPLAMPLAGGFQSEAVAGEESDCLSSFFAGACCPVLGGRTRCTGLPGWQRKLFILVPHTTRACSIHVVDTAQAPLSGDPVVRPPWP